MSKKLLFNFNREVIQNYTYVKYVGTIITATNTLEKPIKSTILKGSTKYRDIDTGKVLDTFDKGRNLELVSVKMPVLTTYTNLFTGFITKGFIGTDGVHYGVDSDINYLSDFIEITNNKLSFRLFTSQDKPLYMFGEFAFYDKNKALISCKYGSTDEVIETPNGTKYIRVWGVDRANPTDNVKGMLIYSDEKPSNIATYKPHKTNILTVNEEVELRGIGDVRDELDLLTGEVVERVGEYQITGEENWQFESSNRRLQILKPTFLPNIKCGAFASDILEAKQANDSSLHATNGTYYIGYTSDGWIRVILGEDLSSLKQGIEWLKANKPTIQYQLKTESIKTVDLSILDQNENKVSSISSFNDTTHITASSETIPPIFEGYLATKEVK
ncbi:MAG: hypothetical protein J6D33_11935 [Turicibacter sp.]|nr:hypothetical protein [Turicibacter sp.]